MHLIYDCEIIKCIPTKEAPISEDYEYCSSWTDFKGMGISVIGYFIRGATDPAYSLAPFDDFKRAVQEASLVIGFNSWAFDDNLCKANEINILTRYDLLREIRFAALGSYNWRHSPKGYSYGLGKIAEANGMAKTGTGELAPQLWQQGKRKAVIDYCLKDVMLTEAILDLGLKGELKDPNTGKWIKLRPLY
jgi:hypothetical protein